MRGLNTSAQRVKQIIDSMGAEHLRRIGETPDRVDPDRRLRFRTGAIEGEFRRSFGGSRTGVHIRVADGLRRLRDAGLIGKVQKGIWETRESYPWSSLEWVFDDTRRALAAEVATLETNPFLMGHGRLSGAVIFVWKGHAPRWARSSLFFDAVDRQPVPAIRQAMRADSKLYSRETIEKGHRLQRSVRRFLHDHPEWSRYMVGEVLGELMAHTPCVVLAYPERVLTAAEAKSVGPTDPERGVLMANQRLEALLRAPPARWSRADREGLVAAQKRMTELRRKRLTSAEKAENPVIAQFYTFTSLPKGNGGPVAMGPLDRTRLGANPMFLRTVRRGRS